MSQTSTSSLTSRLRLALHAGVSLLLLGAVVLLLHPQRYWEILRSISMSSLLIAVGMAVAGFLVRAVRWHFLATQGVPLLTWAETVRSTVMGCRTAPLGNAWQARIESAEALNGENRLGLGGLALLDVMLDALVAVIAVALNVFGLNALAVVGFLLALFLSLIEHVRRMQWTTQGILQRIARALAKTSVADVLIALLLSALIYGCALLQFHFLLVSCGAGRLDLATKAGPVVFLVSYVPVGIFRLGLPQIAAAATLSSSGRAAEGVVTSLLFFLLNHALPRLIACAMAGARASGTKEEA
ncbi:hypothetical protein JXA88_19220 [Candidatus Fermentibacteria bacterium]|nr:hypothetical protein [Candidatus Fermentibacteria bacterium]